MLLSVQVSKAGSLSDLLGRFDDKTLGQLSFPVEASQSGEWGKLLYRLERISSGVLAQRCDDSASPPLIGDAIAIQGEIDSVESMPIPSELIGLLELRTISIVRLNSPDGMIQVITTTVPSSATEGDQLSGYGVVVRASGEEKMPILAAGRLIWSPRIPASPTQSLLARGGIDLPRFADSASRQRQPLTAADSDLFFKMIRIANTVISDGHADAAEVRNSVAPVQPSDLLKEPQAWSGRWISLNVETVRWTRIAVQDTQRRAEVGADFYYEIDAIGDLGNTQLRIETAEGPPVVMENRFPVTLVSATLPSFLEPMDDPNVERTLSHNVSVPVQAVGFFYRLWSYESEFMEEKNAGDQFAPLIFVGDVVDRRSSNVDSAGVHWIGTFAATATVIAFVGILYWNFKNRKEDRRRKGFASSTDN